MRATSLGHASWLVEAGALRILSDPLVQATHAGGMLAVSPARTLDAGALRPDFILVTHAHFDHFDLESLDALARADADSVVVTPDEVVAACCRTLGFHTVHVLAPGQRVDLADGVALTTTPSRAPDVEWGYVVRHEGAAIWNLVDSTFASASEVRQIAAGLGGPVDLAIAPLQPMREVAMAMSGHTGFEVDAYEHQFACARATGAAFVVPGATGEAFVGPCRAMNHVVHPVSRARAARDFARFAPAARVLSPELFDVVEILPGHVDIVGREALGVLAPAHGVEAWFRPWDVPPLVDDDPEARPPEELAARIERWLHEALEPALAHHGALLDGLSLSLEVVLSDRVVHFSATRPAPFERRADPECDELVAIAGSSLVDVLEGRRSFMEPLLGGKLRATSRGVRVREGAVASAGVPPVFLYFALDFRASVEAAARRRAKELAAQR